jgi:hypothetical protein
MVGGPPSLTRDGLRSPEPASRQDRGGGPPLKFYDARDNLKRTVGSHLAELLDGVLVDNQLINIPLLTLFKWDGKAPIPMEVWERVARGLFPNDARVRGAVTAFLSYRDGGADPAVHA